MSHCARLRQEFIRLVLQILKVLWTLVAISVWGSAEGSMQWVLLHDKVSEEGECKISVRQCKAHRQIFWWQRWKTNPWAPCLWKDCPPNLRGPWIFLPLLCQRHGPEKGSPFLGSGWVSSTHREHGWAPCSIAHPVPASWNPSQLSTSSLMFPFYFFFLGYLQSCNSFFSEISKCQTASFKFRTMCMSFAAQIFLAKKHKSKLRKSVLSKLLYTLGPRPLFLEEGAEGLLQCHWRHTGQNSWSLEFRASNYKINTWPTSNGNSVLKLWHHYNSMHGACFQKRTSCPGAYLKVLPP